MSHAPDYTPVYQSVADRKPNGNLKNICFGLIAVGIAATFTVFSYREQRSTLVHTKIHFVYKVPSSKTSCTSMVLHKVAS